MRRSAQDRRPQAILRALFDERRIRSADEAELLALAFARARQASHDRLLTHVALLAVAEREDETIDLLGA